MSIIDLRASFMTSPGRHPSSYFPPLLPVVRSHASSSSTCSTLSRTCRKLGPLLGC